MKSIVAKIAGILSLTLGLTWPICAMAELKLNGLATHTNYGKDQFIAAIYCQTPTSDARALLLDSGDKVMEIRVVAEQLYSHRFKRMWIESMAINSGSLELEKHAQNMVDFASMLRVKLRAGDIFRIERNLETGVRVLVDGNEVGLIADPKFFDLLLRTWIGPVPLSTQFKNQLLSSGQIDENTRRVFYATMPSPERIMAITTALNESAVAEAATDTTAAATAATAAATTSTSAATSAAATIATPSATGTASTQTQSDQPATEPPVDEAPAPAEATQVAASKPSDKPTKPANPPTTVAAVSPGLVTEEDLFEDSILDDEPAETITAESLLNQQLYISKLTRWTGGFVEYPRRALRNEQEGTVRLAVTVNRDGKVVDVIIEEESSHTLLNKAAAEAVKKASPYPAMPATIAGESFAFTVPVTFRLE